MTELTLYVRFARQRMDLVQHYLAKDKPGRSVFVRNTLDDYSNIIESMTRFQTTRRRHSRPDRQRQIAARRRRRKRIFLDGA